MSATSSRLFRVEQPVSDRIALSRHVAVVLPGSRQVRCVSNVQAKWTLSPVHTGDCRRKRRLSPKTATVAENGGSSNSRPAAGARLQQIASTSSTTSAMFRYTTNTGQITLLRSGQRGSCTRTLSRRQVTRMSRLYGLLLEIC